MLDGVRRAGATIYAASDDPLVALARTRRAALRKAHASAILDL